jgi:hypothetical protein
MQSFGAGTSALSGCSFGLGTASKPARNRRPDVRKDTKIARLARELTEAWEQQVRRRAKSYA